MASSTQARPLISEDKLKGVFDMSHFDLNAVIRGVQLTLVGAHRALQNPELFTSQLYKQAALAVVAGIVIRLVIGFPIFGVRIVLWMLSFLVPLDHVTWDDKIVSGLTFLEEHVLQVPLFLMTMMRHFTPTLDIMFMDSLKWVDQTYVMKHKSESPEKLRETYYPNLKQYPVGRQKQQQQQQQGPGGFRGGGPSVGRFVRRAFISLAVYAASYLPVVGRFVLPAASFYTFNRAVGPGPACLIFGTGLFLPRRNLVVFLQTYYASRNLVRELLEPYFARVPFTTAEKKRWFHSREGILFGFGVGFYVLLRVPLLGVLIYGVAEASTAFLVTKITDPPPPPARAREFAAAQQEWHNRQKFLSLSLANIDDALHDKLHLPLSPQIDGSLPGSTASVSASSSASPPDPPAAGGR